jgi:hypothetical protein
MFPVGIESAAGRKATLRCSNRPVMAAFGSVWDDAERIAGSRADGTASRSAPCCAPLLEPRRPRRDLPAFAPPFANFAPLRETLLPLLKPATPLRASTRLRSFVSSCLRVRLSPLRLTHSDGGTSAPRLQRRNAPRPPWRRRKNPPPSNTIANICESGGTPNGGPT